MFSFLFAFKCLPSRCQLSGFIYSQNEVKTPAHTVHLNYVDPRSPPQGLSTLVFLYPDGTTSILQDWASKPHIMFLSKNIIF